MEKKKTYLYIYVCMAALLFVGAAISLSVGSAEIGIIGSIKLALSGIPGIGQFVDISAYSTMQRYIILQVRLPRVLLAALVGAGLSAAGGVFQGIFQNPLADPHILGVSSGAALGATIAILFGVQVSVLGIGTIGVCFYWCDFNNYASIFDWRHEKGSKDNRYPSYRNGNQYTFFSCDVTSYVP